MPPHGIYLRLNMRSLPSTNDQASKVWNNAHHSHWFLIESPGFPANRQRSFLVMQSLAMPRWQFRYITSFSVGLMKTPTVARIAYSICIVFFRIFGLCTFCNRYRSFCLFSKLSFSLFYLYSKSKQHFVSLLLF